jgi:hypothetical protein
VGGSLALVALERFGSAQQKRHMEALSPFGLKPYHGMHQPGSMTRLCVQPECNSHRIAVEPVPYIPSSCAWHGQTAKGYYDKYHDQCRVLELTAWMMSAVVLQGVDMHV